MGEIRRFQNQLRRLSRYLGTRSHCGVLGGFLCLFAVVVVGLDRQILVVNLLPAIVLAGLAYLYVHYRNDSATAWMMTAQAASLPAVTSSAIPAPAVTRKPAPSTTVSPRGQRALIIGAGEAGSFLVHQLQRHSTWGFQPIALLDDNPHLHGGAVHDVPVLGAISALPDVVAAHAIDVVIIAIPSAPDITIARISQLARQTKARVLTMPNLGALLRGESTAAALRSLRTIDVLGRPVVPPDVERCRQFVADRRVLITGAAGSIGQELTRQVAQLGPAKLTVLDVNETGLFDLEQEIAPLAPDLTISPIVASVTNLRRMQAVFSRERPEIVFHAAAFKHVPLMEMHPEEAVMVNSIGTQVVASLAAAYQAKRFVLVSTDKAVHPTSVMGGTKRVAELAVRAVARETGFSACSVRFGNVLGSRGSVLPTFTRQINAGGPVTVTDPRMKRFFMTISEAASLIIQAGAFGDHNAIYLLDMGEEISILQLAERIINLSGLRLGEDIQIVFTGLRPGEKLREELVLHSETMAPTPHPKISRLLEAASRADTGIPARLDVLRAAALRGDRDAIREALFDIIIAIDGPAPNPVAAEPEAIELPDARWVLEAARVATGYQEAAS